MKYRVEPFDCDTWSVVDPNGNVCSQRDDEEDAKTEAHAFNRAYELGESAALSARDAALERVRVLEAECRAARVLLVNDPVAGAIPEDCWTLATDIPRFADTNYSDARRATDAANALGDGAS